MSNSAILVDDLTALRQRRSMKWDSHPDDVRPLWVAEMDCVLAEPVRHALAGAVDRRDTGYAHRPDAPRRPTSRPSPGSPGGSGGGRSDPERAVLMPDVMQGASHALRRSPNPATPMVITPPVYPPFFHHLVVDLGRRIVDVPLLRDPDGAVPARPGRHRRGVRRRRGRPAAVQPAQPDRHRVHGRGAGRAGRGRGPARRPGRGRRDPRPAGARGPAVHAVPHGRPGARVAVHSGSKAFNLAGLKAALAVAGPDAAAELARVPDEVSVAPGCSACSPGRPPTATATSGWAGCWPSCGPTRSCSASLLAEQLPEVRWTRAGRDVPGLAGPARARSGAGPGRGAAGPRPGGAVAGSRFRRRRRAASPGSTWPPGRRCSPRR